VFVPEFRQAFPAPPLALVLDNSGSHVSGAVPWPVGLPPIGLPAYRPELKPAERLFEELRGALSNQVFESLEVLEQALTEALRPYWDDPAKLVRLTA
jgi:transposase